MTFNAAAQAGIEFFNVNVFDLAETSGLSLSDEAKTRITLAVQNDQEVIVPTTPININGQEMIAWLEIDPTTGYAVAVGENGAHRYGGLFCIDCERGGSHQGN